MGFLLVTYVTRTYVASRNSPFPPLQNTPPQGTSLTQAWEAWPCRSEGAQEWRRQGVCARQFTGGRSVTCVAEAPDRELARLERGEPGDARLDDDVQDQQEDQHEAHHARVLQLHRVKGGVKGGGK